MSDYLLAPLAAWTIAQLLKYGIVANRSRNYRSLRTFLASGSMPSVHTAVVTALALVIGYRDGWGSSMFALASVFAIVVAYDAMQVRRAAGEQGAALSELTLLLKKKLTVKPYQALGHKPKEVAVGALIGLISVIIVLSF